jgi:hypothetical protein
LLHNTQVGCTFIQYYRAEKSSTVSRGELCPGRPPEATPGLRATGEVDMACRLIRRTHPNKRGRINQDIGSWCGIFATYCLRAAGLSQANWDRVGRQDSGYFSRLGYNDAVRRGDIGVYRFGRGGTVELNHHFVVVEDAEPGAMVRSIDGNVGIPDENVTATTWYSVISERKYFRKTLQTAVTAFLRPNFAALR